MGNSIIASLAITILARLLIGWLCDGIGPRRAYAGLPILGSLPAIGIGLSHNNLTFLIFRLAIGAIGASFVITQYHTSVMFAPNVAGTANAAAAGWGNLGGGVTQMAMPLRSSAFPSLGVGAWWGWHLAMAVPGVALVRIGIAYCFVTEDTSDGAFQKLRGEGRSNQGSRAGGVFLEACHDSRVWALATLYGSCFGMELTIDNVAVLYFTDYFHLTLKTAGLFVKMSNGATCAVVPFVNPRALGAVASIVGAGGNRAAVLAGFIFKSPRLSCPHAFLILGGLVGASSLLAQKPLQLLLVAARRRSSA